MSSKMYRINVSVAVTEEKQKELTVVLKEKKGLDSVHAYFSTTFTKVLERAAQEIQRGSSAKSLTWKLFHNDVAKDSNDYVFNFGVQGLYDELIQFLENQYVHSVLKFVTNYSKSKMYKPYDNDKKPYGDYYMHIGEGGFSYNLPHVKDNSTRGAKGSYAHALTKETPQAKEAAQAKETPGSANAPTKEKSKNTPPPPFVKNSPSISTERPPIAELRTAAAPPCELEIVSRSLADKMRKMKQVDAQYELIAQKVKELLEKQEALVAQKVELKEGVAKLKKQLNNLMEEEETVSKEPWTPAKKKGLQKRPAEVESDDESEEENDEE